MRTDRIRRALRATSSAIECGESMTAQLAGDVDQALVDVEQIEREWPVVPSAAPRIAVAIAVLGETYSNEGVAVWLLGENWTLGGRSPLSLLREGDVSGFERAVRALGDWDGLDPERFPLPTAPHGRPPSIPPRPVAMAGSAPCPCGRPVPAGSPPCTVDRPCVYAADMPPERWPES